MALFPFDASTVAPDQGAVAPIPAGVYNAMIVESGVVKSKAGDDMIKLTWQVVDGPHKGRKVWQSLNVGHKNPEPQRIARAQFSGICHALGRIRINDTVDLHNVPARIKVTVKVDESGQYPPQNEVRGIEPLSAGSAPTQATTSFQAPQQAAAPAPAATAANTPPWAKRAA
jgi:hypothetical protein